MSATTDLSDEVFYERFSKLLDAFRNDDDAAYQEIAATLPLPPIIAKRAKHYMTKEDILECGWDMSLVVAELGEDWYEQS